MRISYYSDTDTLYIDLKDAPGADTVECMDDFVVDVDSDGKPVGIEIEHASEKADLLSVQTEGLSPASGPPGYPAAFAHYQLGGGHEAHIRLGNMAFNLDPPANLDPLADINYVLNEILTRYTKPGEREKLRR